MARCRAVHDDLSPCTRLEGHEGEHRKAKGPTPQRPFRVPDDVYRAAQAKADAEGTTVTAVVVDSLRRYIRRPSRSPDAGAS